MSGPWARHSPAQGFVEARCQDTGLWDWSPPAPNFSAKAAGPPGCPPHDAGTRGLVTAPMGTQSVPRPRQGRGESEAWKLLLDFTPTAELCCRLPPAQFGSGTGPGLPQRSGAPWFFACSLVPGFISAPVGELSPGSQNRTSVVNFLSGSYRGAGTTSQYASLILSVSLWEQHTAWAAPRPRGSV